MNEFVYKLVLDLNCAKTPPVICSGQFDKGRKFEFTITANGEPYDVTGCSAILKGVRTDGSHFAVECTVSNGKIIKTLDDTTLSVRGKTVAKLVISDSTKSYSTQMFIIDVDSALDGDITVADDYSILNRLIEQIHALNESGAILIDDTIDKNSNNAVANKAVAIALAQKSDKSATYTKTEVDTALNKKPDKATTLADYGITDGENIGNKVTDKSKITDENANYPSVSYLSGYYYDYSEVDDALSGKLDNTAGSVKTDNIASKAVTNEKIANGTITALKLANNAVSGSNIAQNQISTRHLQSGAVTIAKLSDDLLNYIKTSSGTGGGKSAYDIAVDNGYKGTQAEWLASLKGDKGDKGDAPVKGIDYWTNDDKAEIMGDQATPLFANDISECTDTSRVYLLSDGFLYAYIKTVIEKTAYTNQLPISTDNKGNVYTGVGYASGRYSSSSAAFGSLKADEGYYTTGLIPFKMGQTLRVKGANISELPVLETKGIYPSFAFIGSSRTAFIGGRYFNWTQNLGMVMDTTSEYYFVKSATISNDICTFVTDKNTGSSISADDVCYISLSLKVTDPSAVIITVDEEITDELIEEYDYNWANTGHAYTPADYEDRIVALESKLANFGTDMIYGIVDEDNSILMGGTLEVGTYTLKYQNADGTATEIGTFEVV